MEPRIQYAKTEDGVNIAYADVGDGPPLVVVPGPGVNHAQHDWVTFAEVLEPLAQDSRVINFDVRGTGLSDRAAVDFRLESMNRDLEAVVAQTNLEELAILAVMDAVPIAITFAAKHQGQLSHLILIDGWYRFSDFGGPIMDAHEAMRDQDWTVFTETMGRVLAGIEDQEQAAQFGAHMRACIDQTAHRAFMSAAREWDVSALLTELKAKTLVFQSSEPRFVPASAGQELAARIPDAQFLAIDGRDYASIPARVIKFMGVDEAASPSKATSVLSASAVRPMPASGDTHTILITDMASSTQLTQRLGDAAAQGVRRPHNEIVRSALSTNGGSEIKHTGDGIMASFSTASSALDAAIAIQRGVQQHKAERPDSPLAVYVGLNAGEPIAEDEDLFGTAINLAARICDHARPGQILASNVVRELAAGKDFLFSDVGETELRGFEDPVKLWELRWQDER